MIPQRVPNPHTEPVSVEEICALASRWGVTADLAGAVVRAQGELPFDIWIFSGSRGREQQEEVSATPFDRSTHADVEVNGCPRLSTAVDVLPISPALRIDDVFTAQMGAALTRQGLRWGGGAPVDDRGIPVANERWHVDLGARST